MAAPIVDKRRAQLHQDLDSFLYAASTQPTDIRMLSNYLQDQPQYDKMQDLVPAEEIEERLQLAREISARLRDGGPPQLTALELSVIMAVPLGTLRGIKKLVTQQQLEGVGQLVKKCTLVNFEPWSIFLVAN